MDEGHKSAGASAVADHDQSDPWLSLPAAAELRGKSKLTLALEALDPKVRKQRVGGRWYFHRDDIVALGPASGDDESGE